MTPFAHRVGQRRLQLTQAGAGSPLGEIGFYSARTTSRLGPGRAIGFVELKDSPPSANNEMRCEQADRTLAGGIGTSVQKPPDDLVKHIIERCRRTQPMASVTAINKARLSRLIERYSLCLAINR